MTSIYDIHVWHRIIFTLCLSDKLCLSPKGKEGSSKKDGDESMNSYHTAKITVFQATELKNHFINWLLIPNRIKRRRWRQRHTEKKGLRGAPSPLIFIDWATGAWISHSTPFYPIASYWRFFPLSLSRFILFKSHWNVKSCANLNHRSLVGFERHIHLNILLNFH